jgi:hypothetical protein
MVRAAQVELQPLVVAEAQAEVLGELEILVAVVLAARMAGVVAVVTAEAEAAELWFTEMEYL